MKRRHHRASKGLVPPAGPGCLPRAQPRGMERRGQEALINTIPKKYCCALNKSGREFLQDLCPLEMSCSAAPPLRGGHFGKGIGTGGLGGWTDAFDFFTEGWRRRWHGFIPSTSAPPSLPVPSFISPPAVRCKHNGRDLPGSIPTWIMGGIKQL